MEKWTLRWKRFKKINKLINKKWIFKKTNNKKYFCSLFNKNLNFFFLEIFINLFIYFQIIINIYFRNLIF